MNEAIATGVPPEGVEPPTDGDSATVDVPTPDNPGTGLPQTGMDAPVIPIVIGALVALLLRTRRTREAE